MEDAGHKVSVPFTFDSKIIETALHRIQSRQLNPRKEIDPGLFAEVDRIMESAVEAGYTAPAGSYDFREQIRNNTEVFAAFKAHRMGRDMAAQLLDENGQLKSFRQFKKDTEGIVSHHVDRWLRTEYDTAVKRAHKAAEMQQFRDEADVFPNIEWLPSTAVNPREEHKPFYHHIWPIDDPFWEHHKPGDEWGCQCDWRATDEPVTDNTGLDGDGGPSVSKGLGGDPSKTGQLFTDDHPYFPSDCKHCGFYKPGIKDRIKGIFTARVKDCYNCPFIRKCINELPDEERKLRNAGLYEIYKKDPAYKEVIFDKESGGMSAVHKQHKFDSETGRFGIKRGDYEKQAVEVLRLSGHSVVLESEKRGYGVKTPDGFIDGTLMDIKSIEGVGKWAVKEKLHDGTKQGITCVILNFVKKDLYSPERVAEGWKLFTEDHDSQRYPQTIKRVICIIDETILEWPIPK